MASKKIIVIGAGLAGIAAARILKQQGHDVLILEARDRMGGRTWTESHLGVPLDLGAFIIHGVENNVITELNDQFNIPHQAITLSEICFYAENGEIITGNDFDKAFTQFFDVLNEAKQIATGATSDCSLHQALKQLPNQVLDKNPLNKAFSWFERGWLNLYFSADSNHLTARHWDYEQELGGGHHLMSHGYGPLVEKLAANLSIVYNTKVDSINYQDHVVTIATQDKNYQCDAVIITVPLGVLKANGIRFEPELPEKKKNAIEKLGFGLLNKVLIQFDKPFWPDNFIGFTGTKCLDKIPYFINYQRFFGSNTLLGFIGGDRAKLIETMPETELIDLSQLSLSAIFGFEVPKPKAIFRTCWSQDPFSLGSYSYLPVGMTPELHDDLAEPIANKLFFAGEATNSRFPASTHGAYLSGVREAERFQI